MRLFLESFVEIGPVVSPNGSGHTHTQTDTHTDTHTHTLTHRHLPFFPDTITIHLVNEMTKCKNGFFFVLIKDLTHWNLGCTLRSHLEFNKPEPDGLDCRFLNGCFELGRRV